MARVTLIRGKDQLAADDQWVFDKMMQTRRGSAGPNSVLLYDLALCIVGLYQMLSAIIGAFEIGPEQGSEPLPE